MNRSSYARKIRMTLLALVPALFVAACESAEEDADEAGEVRSNMMLGRTDSLPFSSGVLVGNTLYIAGTLGLDSATRLPPAAVEDEVRIIMDTFGKVLAEAGMTMSDLVSVTVYCPDLTLYAQFNAVYRSYFSTDFPARAFIGSGPLLFGARFEMLGTAVKRRS